MFRKKMMPIVSFLLVMLFTIGSCTGCSRSKASLLNPKKPVTITIWHYYNSEQKLGFDQAVSEFNETTGRERGIIVEAFSKDSISGLQTSLLASANKDPGAEDFPDIFAAYSDIAYDFDQLGLIVDLEEYFSEKELDLYLPAYIESGRLGADNAIKLLPIAKSTEILYLNQTEWDKFAAATNVSLDDLSTWEGLSKTAGLYYEYSGGKAFFGRDSLGNYLMAGSAQLGHPIIPDSSGEARVVLDEPTLRTLWDNYYVPFVKGYYAAESNFRSGDIKTGTVAAAIMSTSGASYFPTEVTINDSETYTIESLVLPVPNFAGFDSYAVQQGAGMAISKSSPEKEYASSVFLKWFTEPERNMDFSISSGYLPVEKNTYEPEFFENFMANQETAISPVIIETLNIAREQMTTRTLYSQKAFNGSNQIRDYLADSLNEIAAADRKSVLQLIEQGSSYEDAISGYISHGHFKEWYEKIRAAVETYKE